VVRRPYRVRFFFDYGSGICLWAGNALTRERFGYPIEPEQLGLSPATTAEVEHLLAWYDQSLDWEHPPEAIPWSQAACGRFNAAMLQLLAALQRELGGEYELVNEQPAM
jgi:hypothetical protein